MLSRQHRGIQSLDVKPAGESGGASADAVGARQGVDEMTWIQALEHLFPDEPTRPGIDAKMEFEYIRHGTLSMTGFFKHQS